MWHQRCQETIFATPIPGFNRDNPPLGQICLGKHDSLAALTPPPYSRRHQPGLLAVSY